MVLARKGMSTITSIGRNQLSYVQVGDEILKMTNKGSRDFTKVTGLPHSPTTQQMYAVELKSKYLRAAVAAKPRGKRLLPRREVEERFLQHCRATLR
mgnify:CR=1 FL=1